MFVKKLSVSKFSLISFALRGKNRWLVFQKSYGIFACGKVIGIFGKLRVLHTYTKVVIEGIC